MKNEETIKTYKDIDTFEYNTADFTYQEQLTKELDDKTPKEVNQNIVNEIVLWKVNRYVRLDDETIGMLNNINDETRLDDPIVLAVIEKLLNTEGIRLAMASTILRFRNPKLFQIIDQRAYRVVYGEELPEFDTSKENSNVEYKIKFYINYLKKIREVADEKDWRYEDLDRLLYMLDKKINNNKKIKT